MDNQPDDGDGRDYVVAGKLTEAFNAHDVVELCAILQAEVSRIGSRKISERTSLTRSAIHAALNQHRNPTLVVLLAIMRAVEMTFAIHPAKGVLSDGPDDVPALRRRAKGRKPEQET